MYSSLRFMSGRLSSTTQSSPRPPCPVPSDHSQTTSSWRWARSAREKERPEYSQMVTTGPGSWVSVKELKANCHNSETRLLIVYPYLMDI